MILSTSYQSPGLERINIILIATHRHIDTHTIWLVVFFENWIESFLIDKISTYRSVMEVRQWTHREDPAPIVNDWQSTDEDWPADNGNRTFSLFLQVPCYLSSLSSSSLTSLWLNESLTALVDDWRHLLVDDDCRRKWIHRRISSVGFRQKT